jgi:hypothetical protein
LPALIVPVGMLVEVCHEARHSFVGLEQLRCRPRCDRNRCERGA